MKKMRFYLLNFMLITSDLSAVISQTSECSQSTLQRENADLTSADASYEEIVVQSMPTIQASSECESDDLNIPEILITPGILFKEFMSIIKKLYCGMSDAEFKCMLPNLKEEFIKLKNKFTLCSRTQDGITWSALDFQTDQEIEEMLRKFIVRFDADHSEQFQNLSELKQTLQNLVDNNICAIFKF